MTTFDQNKLAFHYATALENDREAKAKEESEFYPIELTLERVEGEGWIRGYEFGAIAGFRHAIALLNAEGFTEHAQILVDQLADVQAIFEAGE